MGRVAKIMAFLFRLLNFFLDLLQTWQFAGSGGMGGVMTFIISWFQGMPIWAIILLSLAVSIIIAIILSLVFKTFRRKKFEDRELRKLPRLIYDIHKRISTKRIKLVKNTDWDNIDKSKGIEPMVDFIFGNSGIKDIKIDDDVITKGTERLNTIGSSTSGAPSVLDSVLKKSDTSLDKELKKDFRYQYLLARLDGYKPYPNNAIRNSVQTVIDSSISGNNVILWLKYSPSESFLSFARTLTELSDIQAQEIQITNENTEKILNDAIDIRTTQLRMEIENYLK